MRLSHLVAAGLAMVVALGGCSSSDTPPDDSEPIGGTVAPSPTPSPTPSDTASVDITQVPDEIDEAYVAAVLAEYERVSADAMQAAVGQETVFTDGFALRMQAWWTQHFLGRIQPIYEQQVTEFAETTRERLRPNAREIEELVTTDSECVVVETTVDNSGWTGESEHQDEFRAVVALVPKNDDADDPMEVNPTPWLINLDADPGDDPVGPRLCSDY